MKVYTTYAESVYYVRGEPHWNEICDWCQGNDVDIQETVSLAGLYYFKVLENQALFELRWL